MKLTQFDNLIEWLETALPDRKYSLEEVKELLEIAETEMSQGNFKMYDGLPGNIVDSLIAGDMESGTGKLLKTKILAFKSQMEETGN